jgi:beta-glucanase (GH16 family)
MKKIFLFLVLPLFVGITEMRAQLPVNDPAWALQTSLSDSFNTLNLTLWDTTYGYWDTITHAHYNVANGAEWDFGKNDSIAGGYLYIKADTLKHNRVAAWGTFPNYGYGDSAQSLTYAYQGGVMATKGSSYQYGYLEIKAKFPSKIWALWPAFWTFGSACSPSYINEIDIAELSALQVDSGNHVGNNYHIDNRHCSYDSNGVVSGGYDVRLLVDSLSGAFHKYALEWDKDKMVYYFDDVPTTFITDTSVIAKYGVRIILGFGIEPWDAILPSGWTNIASLNRLPTKWPEYFIIDYFNYYKLTAHCLNHLSVCAPTDYTRDILQYIIVGGGPCTPNYNGTNRATSYTLRATDYVLLDAGTTINPSSAGYFAIEMMTCPY